MVPENPESPACWRPQPLVAAGRKRLSGRVMCDAHSSGPSDLPGAGFPVAGSVGPHQPGEGTAGSSEMDGPKFPAQVSSSIIYKECDVALWDLIHNAFLMPFEHDIRTIPC